MTRDEAYERLKVAYPDYEKGDAACMDEFIGRLESAMDNADFGWLDVVETGELNPSSEMPTLVRHLQKVGR